MVLSEISLVIFISFEFVTVNVFKTLVYEKVAGKFLNFKLFPSTEYSSDSVNRLQFIPI